LTAGSIKNREYTLMAKGLMYWLMINYGGY